LNERASGKIGRLYFERHRTDQSSRPHSNAVCPNASGSLAGIAIAAHSRCVDEDRAYIERELAAACPAGYTITSTATGWMVVHQSGVLTYTYGVSWFAAQEILLVTHGNTDAGPIGLHSFMWNATVIHLPRFRDPRPFPLALREAFARVFESPPNTSGLS
jgi:hypothetical protein